MSLLLGPLLTAALLCPEGHRGVRARTESPRASWAWQPLSMPGVPEPTAPVAGEQGWSRGPIDAFVLDRMTGRGLTPSPPADRLELIRRLTFDLHGLQPEPAAVREFLDDERPLAVERLVDRLLESRSYAERWARHWLDEAHYADTHGYDKDKPRRHAWPYRDWVISALEDDLPWGEFVRLQLAGDVLDPGGPGTAAVGFLAAGPWDFVGHVELREGTVEKDLARSLDRDDMVRTVTSAFVSTTAHCARCHEHRFDPITSEDYYSLQAVFAGVERADRPFDPDPEVASSRRALRAELLEIESDLEGWEQARRSHPQVEPLRARLAEYVPPSLPESLRASVLAEDGTPRLGWHSEISASADVERWVQVDLGSSTDIRRIVLWPAHETFAGHPGPGFCFPLRFSILASDDPDFAEGVSRVFELSDADLPGPGDAPFIAKGDLRARYVRVVAHRLAERNADYAFALAELEVHGPGGAPLAVSGVTASDSIEAGSRWGRERLVDGVLGGTTLEHLGELGAGSALGAVGELVDRSRAGLALARELEAALVGLRTSEELDRLEDRREAQTSLHALPEQEHVYAATNSFGAQGAFTAPPMGRPRKVEVLHRGDVTRPVAEATPGSFVLAGLPFRFELDEPEDEGQRRLALANWLVDRGNPLTWRSAANRFWLHHFGRGLVTTPDDFGLMGSEPSHPGLLDYLACRLRDGATPKELHREIVLSATYRQASAGRPEALLEDPENRLVWRYPRRRLDAESIRDQMLLATGELRREGYGEPGYEAFAFEDDHSPRYLYGDRTAEDPTTLRRSIYRFTVRSVPDPWFEVFDGADPDANTPARLETTTPQQMLALWHSSFALGRAEALARRVRLERPSGGVDGQVERAFWLVCARGPTAAELEACVSHAEERGLEATCRALFSSNAFLYVD